MFNPFKKTKKEPENLKEILKRFSDLEKEIERLKRDSQFNIQKVAMARFNPFKGTGSDQSFSVALLDSSDSGVVITSLYNREGNRVYGKPIKNGQSEYQLSEEEKEVINKAKNEQQDAKLNS